MRSRVGMYTVRMVPNSLLMKSWSESLRRIVDQPNVVCCCFPRKSAQDIWTKKTNGSVFFWKPSQDDLNCDVASRVEAHIGLPVNWPGLCTNWGNDLKGDSITFDFRTVPLESMLNCKKWVKEENTQSWRKIITKPQQRLPGMTWWSIVWDPWVQDNWVAEEPTPQTLPNSPHTPKPCQNMRNQFPNLIDIVTPQELPFCTIGCQRDTLKKNMKGYLFFRFAAVIFYSSSLPAHVILACPVNVIDAAQHKRILSALKSKQNSTP